VLVGHGRVGRRIAQALAAHGIACVVADSNRDRAEALCAQGHAAVCGDASDPDTLVQAHIAQAQWLVIAVPDLVGVRRMVETARTLNAGIHVLVRCHNDDEAALLVRDLGVQVLLSEQALAQAMVQQVLQPAPG
jgi:CPA2 family monovalent cation:H+ antiporter-2